eukprot:TRINITY_DN44068_c0_g1_i1.p1 TRINITY_DN44068_c0_g1~~TRINITY_DN44068_c0_g1_i1.p1  ORF type:complete len:244 (+),score=51.59 TRINITY_DN44068_c0_g1_i1:441-1172(+)
MDEEPSPIIGVNYSRSGRVRIERTEVLKMIATKIRHSFTCFVFYLLSLGLGIMLAVFEATRDPRYIYIEITQVVCFALEVLTGIFMMQSRYFAHWSGRIDFGILICSVVVLVLDLARRSTHKFEFEGFVNADDFLLLFRYVVQASRLVIFTCDAFALRDVGGGGHQPFLNDSSASAAAEEDSVIFNDDDFVMCKSPPLYHHKIRANSYPQTSSSSSTGYEDYSQTYRLSQSPHHVQNANYNAG